MGFSHAALQRTGKIMFGVGTLGTLGSVLVYKNEGTRRAGEFWVRAFPIYLEYRATEWYIKDLPDDEQAIHFARLHQRHSPTVEGMVHSFRGYFLKCAQLISTRDEVVPYAYMHWLKKLQDDVPVEWSPAQVRARVEACLGQPLGEVFADFSDDAVGAASIGQVHRATLLDGRKVVVKVQYERAEQLFRQDLKLITDFCTLAMPHNLPPLREISRQFENEFDYAQEARHLLEVRNNLLPHWSKYVVVPEPVLPLCRKNLLVMEYLPGVKLVDGVRNQYRRIAAARGMTLENLERSQKIQAKHRTTPAEARAMMWTLRALRLFLVTRDFVVNTGIFAHNAAASLLRSDARLSYVHSEIPINIPEVLDLVTRVHAHEVFVNGLFNADPHPGNILLLPDGRIGLIDYGQVKRLSLDERLKYARLIIALADNNREEAIRIYTEQMGTKTRRMNGDVLFRLAAFHFDRDTEDVTGGLNVQLFLEEMERLDPIINLADEYCMLARLSVLLRGMGNAFQLPMSLAQHFRPYAVALLKENNASAT